MLKKAQGLSLNTMVIAAIVLIVLIVLVGIFTGYFGDFVPSLKAASERSCPEEQIKDECDSETEKQVFVNFGNDFPDDVVCCKKVRERCGEFEAGNPVGETACYEPQNCKNDDAPIRSGAEKGDWSCTGLTSKCCRVH